MIPNLSDLAAAICVPLKVSIRIREDANSFSIEFEKSKINFKGDKTNPINTHGFGWTFEDASRDYLNQLIGRILIVKGEQEYTISYGDEGFIIVSNIEGIEESDKIESWEVVT